ncbi:transcription factor IIIC subunit delta N-term-domain-containing protein [Paraphoma chrysanthemicola]|uniref:Transcription factor IIIC subunit delta N-term-domain-containing protein n=1 Tax=Paraphoma chrysanthemicola TaxID=798071 RepID=A0A8K0REK2_9PLEO|nr:transcription factor IIIC subunit delta N-term-domain-containing protein [Paraphoma chrysanthemicola]
MADVTELRCWPSCVDAIDWSQDGIIALASDERVELLFPHTVSFDRDQDSAQWQHVPLQAPWFTEEELPVKEPAPLTNFSIGEEVSASAPIAIAWSPPGLAKHRRCALAALTANLVLSIWSADGKPQDVLSWERKLIINNTLTEYFLGNTTDQPSHLTTSDSEQLRLRTRVRAFSWAPSLPSSHPSGTLGTRLSFGQHMVAVCNEDNMLTLVAVRSPTTTLGVKKCWYAEVLTNVSVTLASESIVSDPGLFDDMMRQQRHISHVSWSPWLHHGDRSHSVIAYATNMDVRARPITYSDDKIELGDEISFSDIGVRFHGPLKWLPTVESNVLRLAIFSYGGLNYLSISASDASIIDRTSHDLDERWDQVSGAIWDSVPYAKPRLHFSSLLSTILNPTAVLEASPVQLSALDFPSWRDQIVNSAVLFSVRNDLKGNTKTKVWGMATSPLGDYIATCHSVHPSDMIEYGSPNDRRGTVAISALRQYRQIRKCFPAGEVSAEGVLFTIKKLVENTVEDSDLIPGFIDEMVEKLAANYTSMADSGETPPFVLPTLESVDLYALVTAFKKRAFFESTTLKDRYRILTSQACDLRDSCDLQRTLIAFRLATALQDLPAFLSKTSFSSEIRSHHDQLIALIQAVTKEANGLSNQADPARAGPAEKEANGDVAIAPKITADQFEAAMDQDIPAAIIDTCDFCSAPIPFLDVFTATCTSGHEFPRCGISFVAIQAPGITKYCGICSTPFLSEEFVLAQEVPEADWPLENSNATGMIEGSTEDNLAQANGPHTLEVQGGQNGTALAQDDGTHSDEVATIEEREPIPITLARVLFLACDACTYCGGKFVG